MGKLHFLCISGLRGGGSFFLSVKAYVFGVGSLLDSALRGDSAQNPFGTSIGGAMATLGIGWKKRAYRIHAVKQQI